MEKSCVKRADVDKQQDNKEVDEAEEDVGWIGPLPTEQSAASKPKKKKSWFFIHIYFTKT